MKSRRHIYIDDALLGQLEQLAMKPGSNMSAIVGDALSAYLERRGAAELDDRLRVRMEKFGNQLNRIERDIGIVMESLALFVRYQLMVTAPLAEADQAAARALAQDRFQAFLDQVSRRLANGKNFRTELLARTALSEGQA